ncbi:MAG: DUF2179 domain-containing protein [Methanomicrobiales archaeon]|nr:DUF2179 domain-containing protein [Methanomicrobiales archaeon]
MAVDFVSFYTSDLFALVILPFLIFFARVCDQSLGTMRVIFVSRGFKYYAPFIGFFEISIWLLAIGQIMRNLNNPLAYVAYAGGFATGIFVGMKIEDRLSIGNVVIRVITKDDATTLLEFMREEKFGTTTIDGDGAFGKVKIIFSVINRRAVPEVVARIRQLNPHAFYSIEDVRHVNEGVFPDRRSGILSGYLNVLPFFRKGK